MPWAPDGSEVRLLPSLETASAAHFRLGPGEISKAGRHLSVSEIWYVVAGSGKMWRRDGTREEVVALEPGIGLTIPLGTSFQFRAEKGQEFCAIGFTIPPWPTDAEEWVEVDSYWELPH